MKKFILLIIVSQILFSGCATMFGGGRYHAPLSDMLIELRIITEPLSGQCFAAQNKQNSCPCGQAG